MFLILMMFSLLKIKLLSVPETKAETHFSEKLDSQGKVNHERKLYIHEL